MKLHNFVIFLQNKNLNELLIVFYALFIYFYVKISLYDYSSCRSERVLFF